METPCLDELIRDPAHNQFEEEEQAEVVALKSRVADLELVLAACCKMGVEADPGEIWIVSLGEFSRPGIPLDERGLPVISDELRRRLQVPR